MHCKKNAQYGQSLTTQLNYLVSLVSLVFVSELTGCDFDSRCRHVNFRYPTCFRQGIPCDSGNYRV